MKHIANLDVVGKLLQNYQANPRKQVYAPEIARHTERLVKAEAVLAGPNSTKKARMIFASQAEVAAPGHDPCVNAIKPDNLDAWLNADPKHLSLMGIQSGRDWRRIQRRHGRAR